MHFLWFFLYFLLLLYVQINCVFSLRKAINYGKKKIKSTVTECVWIFVPISTTTALHARCLHAPWLHSLPTNLPTITTSYWPTSKTPLPPPRTIGNNSRTTAFGQKRLWQIYVTLWNATLCEEQVKFTAGKKQWKHSNTWTSRNPATSMSTKPVTQQWHKNMCSTVWWLQ